MNLQTDLKSEHISHLVVSGFAQVPLGTSVRDTLARMRADRRIVCLVVEEDAAAGGGQEEDSRQARLVGIFTERDVMRKVIDVPGMLEKPVDDVMTTDPITIGPDASAADALRLMEKNHFRNLPIVDGNGRLLGIMTHQAIISYLADRYPVEVLNRPSEPERFPRRAEGG
ncbi:MAG: CBS domain-containing protein [Caldilineaceae bacterium]|nr:CBS domain-containing protein [Caldilineaceae bacterium]